MVPLASVASPLGAVVTVVTVIDGDTLEVSGAGGSVRVRLIGVNAPEVDECFAAAATAALAALATGEVVLIADTTDVDQFGRALRYVETPAGVDVGAELVRGGYAISRRYEPDVARSDRYDRLQAEAQAGATGLWASDACGDPVDGVSVAVEINFDAAGNDSLNLNDEWVRFTNVAGVPLDLSGWTVADESASHRYAFGDFVLPAGAAVTVYSGCGSDTEVTRFWCNTESAIWNNDGDTVFLRDANGNNVVTRHYEP
jgi:micrococcal nuclease